MSLPWHIALASLPLLGLLTMTAHAACTFTPTSGNDQHVCDSGNAPSLTDLAGDNSLVLPAGGSGSITSNVTFGAGADLIDIASGSVGGVVDQGAGVDTFIMSGGQIQALQQGNGRDQFQMSGGRIVGAFEDGDVAYMSGGRIGRVDMKLDRNLFDMSGGSIDANLVTGFDRDTVFLRGGRIGGNISVSGGDDSVTISGGELAGNVLLSFGNDRFVWQDDGIVRGAVLMGEGNDQAALVNLDERSLGLVRQIDGGLGIDSLVFEQTQTTSGARYPGWESLALSNASVFTLDDTLTLGDRDSGTGTLQIDAASQLVSRSGVVAGFAGDAPVTLSNAGLIDLSTGGDALGRLMLNGHYEGDNGMLRLNSVLEGDGAASDRLVVNQGSLGGATTLQVNNLRGSGALTSANGIQVVEAGTGTLSSNTAFRLGQPLSAGAYQYYLFKGGISAGSENSWYLRSSVVAPPIVVPPATPPGQTPPPPLPALPIPVPAPGTPALPTPVAGQVIVLYRAEVPVYAVANRAAAIISLSTLGTFHQRQGEQRLLDEQGPVAAGWGRTFGEHLRQQWSGTVSPSLDGNLSGFEVGHDLYAMRSDSGYRQHAGMYVSHSRLNGDVKGFALGFDDNAVGDIRLDGDSVGAYWTLSGPSQWYVDTVLQYTDFDGRARSDRGVKLALDGHALSASVEAGLPLPLNARWVLEPQVQVIARKVDFATRSDGISTVSQDSQANWTGRVGVRLKGDVMAGKVALEPYLRSNLWRSFGGHDTLEFDAGDPIKTDQAATWMDLGAGLSAQVSPGVALYGGVTYSANLDSHPQESLGATLGLRIRW